MLVKANYSKCEQQRLKLFKLHLRYSQDTRDQIMSDKRLKSASSNCILDIPFILCEHPNKDWLHTCDACTNHVGPNTSHRQG